WRGNKGTPNCNRPAIDLGRPGSIDQSRDQVRRRPMRLAGKTAYVTGAASGIGRAIAELFAREGARIAIADLNQAAADPAAKAITATGAKAIAFGVDVTEEAQVDASMDKAAEALDGIDILVSNAGIQIVKPLVEFAFADWKKLLAVHLDGAFLTTRAALRH